MTGVQRTYSSKLIRGITQVGDRSFGTSTLGPLRRPQPSIKATRVWKGYPAEFRDSLSVASTSDAAGSFGEWHGEQYDAREAPSERQDEQHLDGVEASTSYGKLANNVSILLSYSEMGCLSVHCHVTDLLLALLDDFRIKVQP